MSVSGSGTQVPPGLMGWVVNGVVHQTTPSNVDMLGRSIDPERMGFP
jgi:hypothetical protein